MRGLLLFEYGPFASFLRSTVSTELMKTFINPYRNIRIMEGKKKEKEKREKINHRIFQNNNNLNLPIL